MIRLTVKGTRSEVLSELSRRNIAPMYIEQRDSQFVAGFSTCDVAVTSNNRPAISAWWLEGDSYLGKGQGFPVGTVMYYSAENVEDIAS